MSLETLVEREWNKRPLRWQIPPLGRTFSISIPPIPRLFSSKPESCLTWCWYHGFKDKKGLFLSWEAPSPVGQVLGREDSENNYPLLLEERCGDLLSLPCDDFPFSWEADEINRPWQLLFVLKQRMSYFCNYISEHGMSECLV